MTKMRQNYNMTDRTGVVYAENGTELPWSIVYNLCQNRNRVVMTDRTRCNLSPKDDKTTTWPLVYIYSTLKMKLKSHDWFDKVRCKMKLDRTTMWLIVKVRSMPKSKLNYDYRSSKMQSIMKSKHDNDVIDRASVISVKYDTKLSRPNRQCAIYDEDEIGQRRDWSYRCILYWNWN